MKKKNTITTLVLLSVIITLLFSCSQSKEDQYLGYWKEDGKEHSEILEIQKEGEKLYVKSPDLESPASYNKDDKTLSTQLTGGLGSVTLLMNITDDPKKMKMSFNNETANFSKITKEEAEKYNLETKAYYDPDFFVGEWKSDVATESPLEIIKEGDKYYYLSGFLGKKQLLYKKEKHLMVGNIGILDLTIRRTGDQEITAYGDRKYKRVK